MKWICIVAGALAMAAFAVVAQAAISDCPMPPGAIKVALPSGLPPALRKALPDDIALPGEPFDATDISVKGHKHRRYLFVWNIGARWIVATEIGGIALRAAISTYELGRTTRPPPGSTSALHFLKACARTRPSWPDDEIRSGSGRPAMLGCASGNLQIDRARSETDDWATERKSSRSRGRAKPDDELRTRNAEI